MGASKKSEKIFHTERWVDWLSGFISRTPDFWIRLGNLESKFLEEELKQVSIKSPIYVSGLARSGSTILLEILSHHRGIVSHQYKDFPPIYTPFWWNWLLGWIATQKVKPTERAHRDGIMITPDSPEAMEEILWMTFFPNAHNPAVSNILDQHTTNLRFEKFYKNHLRKLLLVRQGNRYLAKANYNLTRLEYLLKLFPDAKFVIPIRHPVTHIASLMKQHELFCKGVQENPRALKHLQRIGHFEFGLDLRPLNTNNDLKTQEIISLWQNQQNIQAWACYWNQIYTYVAKQLQANPSLKTASIIVRFEDFCESPETTMIAVMKHCYLKESDSIIRDFSQRIQFPRYYQPSFSEEELEIIKQETRPASEQFGY